MDLIDVEAHLETALARPTPGSGAVEGSRVRAILDELSALHIAASPYDVAEDVLAIEVNPVDGESEKPTSFGVLFVRRLFLRESEDDPTSAVEVGVDFQLPGTLGLPYEEPTETRVDWTGPSRTADEDAQVTRMLERFDASRAGTALQTTDVEPEVFLQDHDEILD